MTAVKCGARAAAEYEKWAEAHLHDVEKRLRRIKDPWREGLRLRAGATATIGRLHVAVPAIEQVDNFQGVTAAPAKPYSNTRHHSLEGKDMFAGVYKNGQLVKAD